jgi:nicotinamide mononucleotide transporter
VRRIIILVSVLVGISLIIGAWKGTLSLSVSEAWGFVTGAACVWLVVKENIWNWPIGIANSIFFIVLFFNARLYADMSLQWIYVVLGFLGWYWWLHGGEHRTNLIVSRASVALLLFLGLLTVVCTIGLMLFLRCMNDSAPFLDALTTVLSLVAQYLLTNVNRH